MANILYVNPWELSEGAAQDRYEKLVRRLNDRMREMEKRGVTTEAVEKYHALVEDMAEGNKRLPSSVSEDEARQALNRVQDILEMRGSSWRKTKEFSQRGMKTFREKYGIKFDSVKQYTNFWQSEKVQKIKQLYGSGAALLFAEMQTTEGDELKTMAEEYLEDDAMETDDLLEMLGFDSQADLMRAVAERKRNNGRRRRNK